MNLNPIVKKDIKTSARSAKLCWGLFAIAMGLTLVMGFAMLIIKSESEGFYASNVYKNLTALFPAVSITEMVVIAIMSPVLTAPSITSEKERQTFDILMTTPMRSMSIVLGKIAIGVIRILFYAFSTLPILAIPFVLGGVNWMDLLWYMLLLVVVAILGCTIGVFWSSMVNRTVAAVFLSLASYGALSSLTFFPMLIMGLATNNLHSFLGSYYAYGTYYGDTLLFLLINPLILAIGFYARAISGQTIGELFDITRNTVGPMSTWLADGYMWMFLSSAMILAMCLGLAAIAAKKINKGTR